MVERWGKYELNELLATGGMAEVFLAEKIGAKEFRKPVCLKRVLPHLSSKPEFEKMFVSEARIAATLHHPNIVQVFDFDSHDKRLFMAMEAVEGLDLFSTLKLANRLRLRLPVEFSVHVMHGLLAALGYAHGQTVEGIARPVIHRDVSPHNILISQEGIVKLADFGIAKAKGLSAETEAGLIKGKFAYMSPEQASNQDANPLSDLFSAGLVFFEMLTGRRVYEGGTDSAIFHQAKAEATKLEAPGISGKINAVLEKMSDPMPEKRYQSAQEAQNALRQASSPEFTEEHAGIIIRELVEYKSQLKYLNILATGGTKFTQKPEPTPEPNPQPTPQPTPQPNQAQQPKPRSRMKIYAALSLAAVLVVSLWVWVLQNKTQTPEPTVAPKIVEKRQEPSIPPVATLTAQENTPKDPLPSPEATSPVPSTQTAEPNLDEIQSSTKTGHLEVNVRPWAKVRVDGKNKGTTPLKKIRLKTGNHRVTLTNDELSYKKTINVKVRPGKTTSINEAIPENQ